MEIEEIINKGATDEKFDNYLKSVNPGRLDPGAFQLGGDTSQDQIMSAQMQAGGNIAPPEITTPQSVESTIGGPEVNGQKIGGERATVSGPQETTSLSGQDLAKLRPALTRAKNPEETVEQMKAQRESMRNPAVAGVLQKSESDIWTSDAPSSRKSEQSSQQDHQTDSNAIQSREEEFMKEYSRDEDPRAFLEEEPDEEIDAPPPQKPVKSGTKKKPLRPKKRVKDFSAELDDEEAPEPDEDVEVEDHPLLEMEEKVIMVKTDGTRKGTIIALNGEVLKPHRFVLVVEGGKVTAQISQEMRIF
jgi:predicted RNA-binding protein Jag